MSRELKPGFVQIPSNIPSTSEIETKESAPLPSTPKEFREATENALDFGDKHLGLWTADGTELSTIAFEEWTSVSMELDEIFFELNSGILGTQLLNFAKLDDAELINPNIRNEIESLLMQTAPLAKRMNPLIDRLCAVNPTMSRAEILETLREGELNATETLDYISKQPVRKSLLGILHNLGERIGKVAVEEKQEPSKASTLWDFENAKIQDLTPVVILSDPFSSDAESQRYWADRADEPILKRSEQKTQSIIYELENLRQTMEGNGDKKNVMDALAVIESWLESNMILYRDGKEVDFELYHLGMEEPQEVDAIFGSLDIIKHDNPEFFVQLMGINPEGGKSPYFGSFIHKALFNTQKTLDDIVTEAPNLVLKSSMKQLLRIDGTVQRWNFHETISEESLRALARRFAEQIDAAATPEAKAQIGLMQQAMMTKPTIEVAVKRQLEAMKEVNFKELKSELLAKLNDQEHPMLALKAISTLPLIAFRDPEIKKRLTEIFGDESMTRVADLQERCRTKEDRAIRAIFNQIPIFDYENARPTNFFRIVEREAMAKESFGEATARQIGYSNDTRLMFLENVLDGRPQVFNMINRDSWLAKMQGQYIGSFHRTDFEGKSDDELPKEYHSLYVDRGIDDVYKMRTTLEIKKKEQLVELRKKRKARTTMSEQDLIDEYRMGIVSAFLDAKQLIEDFDSFRLRKSDAVKVVKVMFEHLSKMTSYQKFEFLLKHAEKFEDEDVMDFLTWFPVEEGLLREIVLAVPEKYPPVFLEYIKTLHQYGEKKYSNAVERIWIRFIDDAVESLLYKDKHDRRMDSWNEQNIINFARTPGFDEVFCKHAKRIFELYPDMPAKLYGEWGARMVKELEIVEESPEFLKRMRELCPRNAEDDVMKKWERLMALRESVRSDERVVERKEMREMRFIASGLISGFMREFPEAMNESYREMRGIFRERMVGFAEVEKKFVAVSGAQIVDIKGEERRLAIEKLQEKLQEPDVQMFLKYLKDDPEEKECWLLIYRAENREERNYESGWFFVQKNPDSETKAEYMKGVFSIEKQRMVMEDVARNVGFDPKEIRSRSINEVLYDMTVAKELIPENSVEGIWREASGSSFLVRMSNGHPTAINIVDVPWEKAGMCVAR